MGKCIYGAGFIGKQITRTLTRNQKHNFHSYDQLKESTPHGALLSPVSVDVRDTLVVSLVGIMHGSPKDFEDIQWKGASNIAKAAQSVGANLVHFSSIGAGPSSSIPYTRTKGLGEISVLEHCPSATIIRPSLVFGPEDDFFNIFPFLPVFGGGASKFQPVYVEDLMRAVEIIAIADAKVRKEVSGKIMETGSPDVSLSFFVGQMQGFFLEKPHINMFTVTRAHIKQLEFDNVVQNVPEGSSNFVSFERLVTAQYEPLRSII
ncbi:NAD(P)-binding protein [Armillaria solidipes]|uniref:NAD(P)-binding protein n=1 Tax=Armillaria solidipes TaxID=1076256 RepID=A0A2H3BZ23_9AGAR|nr:NAD(P)-binding protein [Armillaria solidipes]